MRYEVHVATFIISCCCILFNIVRRQRRDIPNYDLVFQSASSYTYALQCQSLTCGLRVACKGAITYPDFDDTTADAVDQRHSAMEETAQRLQQAERQRYEFTWQ